MPDHVFVSLSCPMVSAEPQRLLAQLAGHIMAGVQSSAWAGGSQCGGFSRHVVRLNSEAGTEGLPVSSLKLLHTGLDF